MLHFLCCTKLLKDPKSNFDILMLHVNRVGNLLFGFSSQSLTSLFKKERRSEEQHERFALGHKREKEVKNCQKHTKKYKFCQANHSFLRAIRLNHERITHVALF